MRSVVALRLSDEEREVVRAAARARGVVVSVFLRLAAVAEARRIVAGERETPRVLEPRPVREPEPEPPATPEPEVVWVDGVAVELPPGARIVEGSVVSW